MSENKFKCKHCGRECKSTWHLDKHEVACGDSFEPAIFSFTDRHITQKHQTRCPKCLETFRAFAVKDGMTLICLDCGCNFTPRDILKEMNTCLLREVKNGRE